MGARPSSRRSGVSGKLIDGAGGWDGSAKARRPWQAVGGSGKGRAAAGSVSVVRAEESPSVSPRHRRRARTAGRA